jgi:hypothetical protein
MIRRDTIGEKSCRMFVDIEIDLTADEESLAIGGYYRRHPNGRAVSGLPDLGDELYSPEDAALFVTHWTHDAAVVIGCTVNFDTETLEPLLRRHDLAPGWDYHILDVTTFAAGWLRGQIAANNREHLDLTPPFKSRTIAAALGITQPADEQHTALGDARLAQRLYDAVTIN